MGYEFYLGEMLLPVTPSKLTIKIKNQNKTYTLINDGEINILKNAGLTEIEFDALLPNFKYPFSVYKNGFIAANVFLEQLEKLKTELKPFQFIVVRSYPNNDSLFNTNLKVSLEDYSIKEDSNDGMDITVTIKLKQYKEYSTKTCDVTIKQQVSISSERESTNSPAPTTQNKSYTVVKGDCLWNIAKQFYGDGSMYMTIYNANKDKISNPNLIYPGQVLIIPVAGTVSNTSSSSSTKTTSSSSTSTSSTNVSSAISAGLNSRSWEATDVKTGVKIPTTNSRNVTGISAGLKLPTTVNTRSTTSSSGWQGV